MFILLIVFDAHSTVVTLDHVAPVYTENDPEVSQAEKILQERRPLPTNVDELLTLMQQTRSARRE